MFNAAPSACPMLSLATTDRGTEPSHSNLLPFLLVATVMDTSGLGFLGVSVQSNRVPVYETVSF